MPCVYDPKLLCRTCGSFFLPPRSLGKPHAFCSPACRVAAASHSRLLRVRRARERARSSPPARD